MALKKVNIPKAGEEIYDIQDEVAFQIGLHFPTFCQYYESYLMGEEFWIFLEYVGGGTLTELVRSINLQCFDKIEYIPFPTYLLLQLNR